MGDYSLISFKKAVLWHHSWGQRDCSGIFPLSRYLQIPQGICCIPMLNSIADCILCGLQVQTFRNYNSTVFLWSSTHLCSSFWMVSSGYPWSWNLCICGKNSTHLASRLGNSSCNQQIAGNFFRWGLCLASWDLHPKVQGFIEFNQLMHIAPFCYCDSKPPGRFGYESPSISHCTYWNDLHHGQPEPIDISMVSLSLNMNSPKEFIFLVSIGTTQMYDCVTLTCKVGHGRVSHCISQETEIDIPIIFDILKYHQKVVFKKSCKVILFQN